MAAWRLRRAYHMEAGFLNLRLIDTRNYAESDYTNLDDSDRLALAIQSRTSTLNIMNRLEARLEPSFYRALQELQRLRAQRPETREEAEKVTKQTQFAKVEQALACSEPAEELPTPINITHEINIPNET